VVDSSALRLDFSLVGLLLVTFCMNLVAVVFI
jgi:hypothetical protein